MLYSTLIIAASAFAGASAQLLRNGTNYDTPIACCAVGAGTVPSARKEAWCEAQSNTCVELCGGQGSVASNGNTCDNTSLQFTCSCSNGTSLGTRQLAPYEQTIPGQMCRFWFDACINATGTNRAQQFQCELARNEQCGNLTTRQAQTSSSASPSGTAARTSGGSSPSQTSSGSGTASSAAGVAAGLAAYGTPILAGGLLAVFGIAL